eukprot:350272-Chlamydomonas_euryale.AAC.2
MHPHRLRPATKKARRLGLATCQHGLQAAVGSKLPGAVARQRTACLDINKTGQEHCAVAAWWYRNGMRWEHDGAPAVQREHAARAHAHVPIGARHTRNMQPMREGNPRSQRRAAPLRGPAAPSGCDAPAAARSCGSEREGHAVGAVPTAPPHRSLQDLQALGDAVGTVPRALPAAVRALLPRAAYKSLEGREHLLALCCICQCEFEGGESVVLLPCRHLYHDACVSDRAAAVPPDVPRCVRVRGLHALCGGGGDGGRGAVGLQWWSVENAVWSGLEYEVRNVVYAAWTVWCGVAA